MKPDNSDSSYFIDALARGLDVLGLFSRERPTLTFSDVVAFTGLSKATAYRVLWTLEARGYLVRDPANKRYRPSIRVLTLGFTAINNLDIRQIARPHLEELSRDLNLTTSLGMLDDMWVVYLDRIRNRAIVGVLLGVGDRIPAHCASMGKVMLAHLPDEELDSHLADYKLKPCTPRSIQSHEALREELAQVRKQGYAINDGELYSGLRAIAAPIFNSQNRVVASVNLSGSQDEISAHQLHSELSSRIVETGRTITDSMNMIGG
jgi:IclR family pca regulon transcriptional regulator